MSRTTDAFDLLDDEARGRLRDEDHPRAPTPMLATLSHERRDREGWIHERKLDGQRALVSVAGGRPRLLSRTGASLDATYPELLDVIADLEPPDLVADGEVVALDGGVTSFSRLQRRMGVSDAARARRRGDVEVHLYLFDLLHLDGRSTRRLALRDRGRVLRAAIEVADPVRLVEQHVGGGRAHLDEACARGWEGLIAKDPASAYVAGRSRAWLKLRCSHRQGFVIGGFTDPKGGREGFGALLVGYHEDGRLRYAGKVGTGYDARTLRILGEHLRAHRVDGSPFVDRIDEPGVNHVSPHLVADVTFTEWTRDGRLRHPSFLGLRADEAPEDVVRET